MALSAICTHLPPVDVRMTIRAILPHIREHRFHVALHALHFLVPSPQRVICLVVIEFGHGADGAPSGRRMTVLARDCQRAVRATRCLSLWFAIVEFRNVSRRPRGTGSTGKGHQDPQRDLEQCYRRRLPP